MSSLSREPFAPRQHLMRSRPSDRLRQKQLLRSQEERAVGFKVRRWYLLTIGFCIAALLASWHIAFGQRPSPEAAGAKVDPSVREYSEGMLAEGMRTFRFDTFGSEEFWGGKLKLHRAIEGVKNGGTGPGLSPKKALELGLKVDMDAVPKNVAAGIKSGKVDLNDPANTLALLKAGACNGFL
jgi:hypothetical protein